MSKLREAAHAEHQATRRAVRAKDSLPVRLIGEASEIADQPPLVALSMATIVLGMALRRPAVARGGVRMLAAHALATGAKAVLKASIDRTRPAKALAEGHRIGKGRGSEDTDYNSFPSGHTAGAVAVAQAAGRDMPGAVVPAKLAALAVAAVQMPRGKHYYSDVLAGAAIGWASERLVSAAAGRLFRSHGSITEPVLPAHPEAGAEPRRR